MSRRRRRIRISSRHAVLGDGGWTGAVGENPKHRKEIGSELHLVDRDPAPEWCQSRHGFIKAGQVGRRFEIEIVDRIRIHELPREGCLATLARAGEHRYRGAAESGINGFEDGGTVQHTANRP